ncbi:peptidase [Marinithermofilum abyssi]|uniref:Peptidase n=1 Tax=Marinithermofilum abyssi TaxID=1571185 RepID=A0A8J2VHX4_9BACL|nr:prolyl oligopeptidase family serine peptidase [Marinithermofilum abyssi]GGE26748.1 peptidase [Marinithermofilum abyssi]
MHRFGRLGCLIAAAMLAAAGCTQPFHQDRSNASAQPRQQRQTHPAEKDGTIVYQKRVPLHSRFSNRVEVYRIRYLSDGLEVVGYLSKPKGDRLKKHPLIIFNRGGGLERSKINRNILRYFSFLSSKGYVVLGSQYRGNDGGEGHEQYGGSDLGDVLSLFPLADRLPYVDRKQRVMLGYSRGGMMTYLAMKAGVHVKAAAVVGGITDLEQFYRGRMDEPDVIQAIHRMVGDPKVNREEYEKRSVAQWPDKVNAPLLILHGTNDDKVSPNQARKLDHQLIRLNKEHRTVFFRGGDHHLSTHEKERDHEILRWFADHLKQ